MADRNKNIDNQNLQRDFNADKDKNLGVGQQGLNRDINKDVNKDINKDINKDVNRDINKNLDKNKNVPQQGQQFPGQQGQNKN